MGGFVIPAMLLMLGTSLARLQLSNLRTTSLLALGRLALGFAVGMGRHRGSAARRYGRRCVWLLQSSMPAAVFNFVFAERYGREPESVGRRHSPQHAGLVCDPALLVAYVLSF